MTESNAFALFALLLAYTNDIQNISLKTSYGLVVSINQDGSASVSLAEPTSSTPSTTPPPADTTSEAPAPSTQAPFKEPETTSKLSEPDATESCFQYYVYPDYGTHCIWHTTGWPGNPEGQFDVAPDELDERYSATWCAAYASWVDKYNRAFEENECHLGSHGKPFPNPDDEKACMLEGMLLSCWLALQGGVHTVSFDWGKAQYPIQSHDAGEVLSRFVADLPQLISPKK